jgi:flagellar basal-body rod protein FlgB
MTRDLLADATTAALAKTLDGAAARHRAIAENLANVDTPGFQRSDVSFESELQSALQDAQAHPRTALDRIGRVRPRQLRDTASPARVDGNNVDIDREMAHLAQNTQQFEAAVRALATKLRMLRAAISEGRK